MSVLCALQCLQKNKNCGMCGGVNDDPTKDVDEQTPVEDDGDPHDVG